MLQGRVGAHLDDDEAGLGAEGVVVRRGGRGQQRRFGGRRGDPNNDGNRVGVRNSREARTDAVISTLHLVHALSRGW